MAQGGGGGKKKQAKKSLGALRKKLGKVNASGKRGTKNTLRTEASAQYARMVEESMASKIPSDQRAKLTVLRGSATGMGKKITAAKALKHQKKPLTRGRKRK